MWITRLHGGCSSCIISSSTSVEKEPGSPTFAPRGSRRSPRVTSDTQLEQECVQAHEQIDFPARLGRLIRGDSSTSRTGAAL